MKWHILCLITIVLVNLNPIALLNPGMATRKPGNVRPVGRGMSSDCDAQTGVWWAGWLDIVWAYGARSGRVTLCRWTLRWQWRPAPSQKKRAVKKRTPPPVEPLPDEARQTFGDERELLPTAGEDARIPLRLVLRAGVILTKSGIQLRPMIVRLGDDVQAYQALWEQQGQFKAAIQRLLCRRCPLCDAKSGFRCIGSDRRSVIPAGNKERVWLRVQKVECRDCAASPASCRPSVFLSRATTPRPSRTHWRTAGGATTATATARAS
jgi:hypothetical protein